MTCLAEDDHLLRSNPKAGATCLAEGGHPVRNRPEIARRLVRHVSPKTIAS